MAKLQRYQLVEERPSRIQRFVESMRSYWLGPWSASAKEFGPYWGGGSVAAGVSVNATTALNYSAVWNAVSLISSQVGNLPCVFYRKTGQNKDRYAAHPLYRLVHDRPNPELSAFTFREMLQAHVLLWGNAYAEIERNDADRPIALWPITPDRVTPFRRSADAPLEYRVQEPSTQEQFFTARQILHVPGLGFDEYGGYSVIAKARDSFGLGIATERFGSTFFGNGATFGGVISYPGARPQELTEKNYREQLETKHMGPDKAHRLLALFNGAKYERIGIPPNDAQFLETRTFQIDEVARWFNLPPHKLKELMRSTNNNIEQQNLEYYIDCLAPWLERWEQELNEKLISPLERNTQEIEFVVDGLLRGDVAARGTFYRERFNTASLTPNDIRGLENQNAVTGGDEPFVNTAMIPLGLAQDWWQAQIDEKRASIERIKNPPAPVAVAGAEPDPQKQRQLEEDLAAARKKAQEEEDLKDVLASEKQIADAVHGELRAQVIVLAGERDQECIEHALTREARALAEAARDQAQAALRQAETSVSVLSRRLTDAGAAMRDAVLDDLRWLIEHESDRARRAQSSPDKLRTWIGQFYTGHENRCRKVLRPSVRAWVVATAHPEPVEHVIDMLVAEYVSQSQRQLRAVADEHDAETLAVGLEKVLRRWDADRAESIVTRVLNEVS